VETLFSEFLNTDIQEITSNFVKPNDEYKVLELFAERRFSCWNGKSRFKCVALNEIDKWACETLRRNRPNWNVLEGDIKNFNFSDYHNQVDVVTGGFPCQAFSYAGKRLGFEDARGTLFYEFARAVKSKSSDLYWRKCKTFKSRQWKNFARNDFYFR
jgi:DNA (cytosine-5)-methyltransferase 1